MKLHLPHVLQAFLVILPFADLCAQWQSTAIVKVNGSGLPAYLSFGLRDSATYSIDPRLGESEADPPPPYGIFDVRWIDSRVDLLGDSNAFGQGLCPNDYRPVTAGRTQIDTFELLVQADTGKTVTISWPWTAPPAYCDSLIMHDAATDGAKYSLNMLDLDSLGITHVLVEKLLIYWYSDRVCAVWRSTQGRTTFSLGQNYPNPFNPQTTIPFSISRESNFEVKVFNLLGAEITTLVSQNLPPGAYSLEWHPGALSSGLYFYRIEATTVGEPRESFVQIKRMSFIK